jgi:lipopolysaccharide biosynthesis glycosyltransferase
MKKTIVTTADNNRIELLEELIKSIRQFRELDYYYICVLSTNISNLNRQKLSKYSINFVESRWPIKVPNYRIKNRDYLRSCLSIPFINQYFPGYDIYIWIDSDAWVNDPDCINLYRKSAEKMSLGVTPQLDRAYGDLAKVSWFFNIPIKIKSIYYKGIKRSINAKKAKELSMKPTLNAGVWSLHKNAPHWKVWQNLILKCAKKGRLFTADQISMGLMIYDEKLKAEFLPAYCNWLCEVKPFYDLKENSFVEPFLPHHKIGIMHLASLDIRNLDKLTKISTTDSQIIKRSLRYNIL